MAKLLSTREVAGQVGLTPVRINQLIKAGRLPARLIGGSYVIDEDDLKRFRRRPTGRPPKAAKRRGEKVAA